MRLPGTKSFYNCAMNKSVPKSDAEFFKSHGLVDSSDKSKIFVYRTGDKLDKLCKELKITYSSALYNLFDYKKLALVFHIPADELFIVTSHEIAYEIFELINKSEQNIFFPILKEDNPNLDFSKMISIRLD